MGGNILVVRIMNKYVSFPFNGCLENPYAAKVPIINASKTLIPEIKMLLKIHMKTSSHILSAVSHTSIKYMIKIFESWCENPFWRCS